MVSIRSPHSRPRSVVVCDIRPGAASVAYVSLSRGEVSTLATGHSALSLEERSADQAAAQLGTQIDEAVAQAHKALPKPLSVDAVYVVAHSPWVTSSVVHAEEKYQEEEKITEAAIGKLARDALAAAKEVDQAKVAEAVVIRVELNGYPTAAPEGKYAHKVYVASLIGECDPRIRSAAEAALGKAFPGVPLVWRSALNAMVAVAKEKIAATKHYLVVDVGIDWTHIASVRGSYINQRVVPVGVRSILVQLGRKKTPEETLSALRMLARDACSDEECESLKKSLATLEPDLVKAFAEAIGQLASPRRAATDLLLVTHPDMEEWLTGIFSRVDFAQFTTTMLPFTVLTPSALHDAGDANAIHDNSLFVDIALVNIEAQ